MPKKEIVVKSNRLIEAIQTLNLVEARLLQLAIVDARETGFGLSPEKPLELSARRYASAFNVTDDAAYLALIDAEDSLFKRQFTLTNSDGTTTKSRWIQDANYRKGEGRIFVTLTRVVIQEVIRIDGVEQYFTQYRLEQTSKLSSVYSIRLYELLMKWQSVGKTPVFKLETFRAQLGLGVNEYCRMGNFKARVLDLAVEQINKYSDIKVKYEQEKIGRKIEGFKFSFKQKVINTDIVKPTRVDKGIPDLFTKLTNNQIDFFAHKLSREPEFSSKYGKVGESYESFERRLKLHLLDENKVKEYSPFLSKLGFVPSIS